MISLQGNRQWQTPRQALNKAFLRLPVLRREMDVFKAALRKMLAGMADVQDESEEHYKNLLADGLKHAFYRDRHALNTKGRKDLVIHENTKASSPVLLLAEIKRPGNKAEMCSRERLNAKALQELLLYYLEEYFEQNNNSLRHLLLSNMDEFFIFDAHDFKRLFADNAELRKSFQQFKSGQDSGRDTAYFYQRIAAPAIDKVKDELPYTWFRLADYEKAIRAEDPELDRELIPLFKILSPEHLLKLSFANDSNTLDQGFYHELLHIMGLEEAVVAGLLIIRRLPVGKRQEGSLLEEVIGSLQKLESFDAIAHEFGQKREEQLFEAGLELTITWINRLLFLKLLEGQLLRFNERRPEFAFLNLDRVPDFHTLDDLFFRVLALKTHEREADMKERFPHVPYLNSSLFEPTKLEGILRVSTLRPRLLSLFPQTVLKTSQGQRQAGSKTTLDYLFAFLNAYNFGAEGSEEIQEESKTLINAAVLGLIFEKINGYKEGSVFTPGFITTYMCRRLIRQVVVDKFNQAKGWKCQNLGELYNQINDRKEANEIFNSLRICDPAVGSGHFLVSVLNELIAVKSYLGILIDGDGKRLKEYTINVKNDELEIIDDEGELFEYKRPKGLESNRVQKTLFYEKQYLIENCLFGVDINPKSVQICRLRLWIELLKFTHYTARSDFRELEVLPNLDINIKTGNSLLYRFPTRGKLMAKPNGHAERICRMMEEYKLVVMAYKHEASPAAKKLARQKIAQLKDEMSLLLLKEDKEWKQLKDKQGELAAHPFQFSQSDTDAWNQKNSQLQAEIDKLEAVQAQTRENYRHGLEWRFEFPEVLNQDGDYLGFDAVVGNPPYIRHEAIKHLKPVLKQRYTVYDSTADIFTYFFELAEQISRTDARFSLITSNKWLRASYGHALRRWVKEQRLEELVDFGDLPVFPGIAAYPAIVELAKLPPQPSFRACNISTLDFNPNDGLEQLVDSTSFRLDTDLLSDSGWTLAPTPVLQLLEKLKRSGQPLGDYVEGKIFYGIKTGFNEAFVVDAATRQRLIEADPRSAEVLKPFLRGRDVKRYSQPESNLWLIFTRRGIQIERYPAILKHLEAFRHQLEPMPKDWKGDKWEGRKPGSYKWYELQDAIDYYHEFEKPKIIYQEIAMYSSFSLDKKGFYPNNKIFIIPIHDLPLLGILNSRLIWFFLNQVSSKLRGDALALQTPYLEQIKLPHLAAKQKNKLEKLVTLVLEKRALNEASSTLEAEIDQLVYRLYGLTADEIALVERMAKQG